MTLREQINGNRKPVGVGAVTGIVVALIAFVTLQMNLLGQFRAEGATAAALDGRIMHLETWVADYERNVRPLRDEFLRLTGELKLLPGNLRDLKDEIKRLNERLDRIEARAVPPR